MKPDNDKLIEYCHRVMVLCCYKIAKSLMQNKCSSKIPQFYSIQETDSKSHESFFFVILNYLFHLAVQILFIRHAWYSKWKIIHFIIINLNKALRLVQMQDKLCPVLLLLKYPCKAIKLNCVICGLCACEVNIILFDDSIIREKLIHRCGQQCKFVWILSNW